MQTLEQLYASYVAIDQEIKQFDLSTQAEMKDKRDYRAVIAKEILDNYTKGPHQLGGQTLMVMNSPSKQLILRTPAKGGGRKKKEKTATTSEE